MSGTSTDRSEVTVRVGRNVLSGVPKVSVVIPAYNSAETIAETIDSVLAQKFREYEIILVNDGSPDTEAFERAIRTRLEDVVYIKKHNAGAGPARNTAIEYARAELIAFLDADDLWLPDYLAAQYVFLGRHGLDLVYCDAMLFGSSPYRRTFMETAPSDGDANFDSLLDLTCNVITSGTIARKEVIERAGMFETERVRAHDFHLWLRIAKLGAKLGYQRKVLLKHRVDPSSLSGDSISRAEREIDVFKRVASTIELSAEQHSRVEKMVAGLEADLAVEQGKAYLLSGDNIEAALAFKVANHYRRSLKLSIIAILARVAPSTLLKYFRKYRRDELALIRRLA